MKAPLRRHSAVTEMLQADSVSIVCTMAFKPVALAGALIASLGVYLGVFSIVHRPLTTDGVGETLQARSVYANSLPSPRLFVWAGSNGRYSHRCETLTQVTGVPCANLSVAMGVGLDIQLLAYEPLLRKGDTVYMPMEYGQYRVERTEMEGGIENASLVHEMRSLLWTLGPRRIARAYGSFDLTYLVHGVVEMSLRKAGVQRRVDSTESGNAQGDIIGHTAQFAARYADFVRGMRFDERPMPQDSYAIRVIERFIERSRARGVSVVAGLPTLPDTVRLDETFLERLKDMLERHGHRLLVLPNRSLYPLECFYDTLYHLNEPCQVQHSQAVAQALVSMKASQSSGLE